MQCVVLGVRNKRQRTSTAIAKKRMLQSKSLLNLTPHIYVRDRHCGAVTETMTLSLAGA